jgi:hypothetical protein
MKQHSYKLQQPLRLTLVVLLLALAAPAFAQYGIGVTQDVPRVDEGAITLDGSLDEEAWDAAPLLDLTQYWNSGYYDCAPNAPEGEVDIAAIGRVLYSDGVLYVSGQVLDYQAFYWGPPGEPYQGEQLLVGVDLTHEGDDQIDDEYGGWPENAPDLGPTTYKISGAPDVGITHNWGFDNIFPVDSGWVAGEVYIDDVEFEWGIEMAIYGDEIMAGNQIGFNMGGAAANEECYVANEDAGYAYYSWQALANGSGGGDVMNNSASFATLNLLGSTANEDDTSPNAFTLRGAFPNPFRASTTIEYALQEAAEVSLAVYDVLGRKVATVVEGLKPAGVERVSFDASGLPAGLYISQLRVNGEVVGTQKMQLIR